MIIIISNIQGCSVGRLCIPAKVKKGRVLTQTVDIGHVPRMDMLQGKKVMSRDGSLHPIKYVLKSKRILVYLFTASYVNRPEFLPKLKTVYQENLKRSRWWAKSVDLGGKVWFQMQAWRWFMCHLTPTRRITSTTSPSGKARGWRCRSKTLSLLN